jgi:hypothetical protein
MMRTYNDFLLVSGIRWLVNRELRQMDRGFYGCRLPHPGVECFISSINSLQIMDVFLAWVCTYIYGDYDSGRQCVYTDTITIFSNIVNG